MPTVYLAGPIENVSTEEATNWREEAAKYLNELGVLVCDPNRLWVLNEKQRGNLSVADEADIVDVDLSAVRTVDALFVWCDKNTRMCGTYIEVGVALEHGKTIAFYCPGHAPGFVEGICEMYNDGAPVPTHMFGDIKSACDWLCKTMQDKD
jgi:nucleoside 2-deoxyribosyltransferase